MAKRLLTLYKDNNKYELYNYACSHINKNKFKGDTIYNNGDIKELRYNQDTIAVRFVKEHKLSIIYDKKQNYVAIISLKQINSILNIISNNKEALKIFKEYLENKKWLEEQLENNMRQIQICFRHH